MAMEGPHMIEDQGTIHLRESDEGMAKIIHQAATSTLPAHTTTSRSLTLSFDDIVETYINLTRFGSKNAMKDFGGIFGDGCAQE
jgi:predicted protein tyrosine phosphatase